MPPVASRSTSSKSPPTTRPTNTSVGFDTATEHSPPSRPPGRTNALGCTMRRMITDEQKATILANWRLVVPIADTAADLFYRRLFELKPEYRQLFGEEMAAQKQKLLQMLTFVVRSLEWGGAAL